MVRPPCCDHNSVKKGAWTPEEDEKLAGYIREHGHGNWKDLPKRAGLNRCGKSCRLRWSNYLRPGIIRGNFSDKEELTIVQLHAVLGNKWSAIAAQLPGRTDNEIKNHWHTLLKKRLGKSGTTSTLLRTQMAALVPHGLDLWHLLSKNTGSGVIELKKTWDSIQLVTAQTDAIRFAKVQVLRNLIQVMLADNPLTGMELDMIVGLNQLQSLKGTSSGGLSGHSNSSSYLHHGPANGTYFEKEGGTGNLGSDLPRLQQVPDSGGADSIFDRILGDDSASSSVVDHESVGESRGSTAHLDPINGVASDHLLGDGYDSLGSISSNAQFPVSEQDICEEAQMANLASYARTSAYACTSSSLESWDGMNPDDQDINETYWKSAMNQIYSSAWLDNILT